VASIQLVLSAYLFSTAIAQLVIGPLSDRFGRRPILIGGLGVFALASLVCTLAPNVGILILGRIAQGAGGCAGMVLGRAIVRDRYERDQAASMLGYVSMAFAIAPMVGPALGGLFNDFLGWRSMFAFQVTLAIVSIVMIVLVVPETRRKLADHETKPRFTSSVAALVRIPAFWGYALTLAFGVAVFFTFLGGSPIIASELLGMSGTEYGLYFACAPIGYMTGNFFTGRFAARVGLTRMMISGTVVAVLGVALMGVLFALGHYHPLSLFVPMFFTGFANGLSFANGIAGAVSLRPQYAGTASGLAGSLQVTGGAIASVLIGVLMGVMHSVFTLIGTMMVFALLSLGAALWAHRTQP
jgi:DHA1 family bicyclomycin/chloramphenicol resistance-like MFS transporter